MKDYNIRYRVKDITIYADRELSHQEVDLALMHAKSAGANIIRSRRGLFVLTSNDFNKRVK